MNLRVFLLCLGLLFVTKQLSAQWDTLHYEDGTRKLVKVLATDGDEMPSFFLGWRGFAQGYVMKIWPRVMIRGMASTNIFERNNSIGSDAIIYFYRFRRYRKPQYLELGRSVPHFKNQLSIGDSIPELQIGHPIYSEGTVYTIYAANLANTTAVNSFGLHLGAKHKSYLVNIQGFLPHDYFLMKNVKGDEFYAGLSFTKRCGGIIAELNNKLNEDGVPDVKSVTSKCLTWMIYFDLIYDRATSFEIEGGDPSKISWYEENTPFPKIGWRFAGDLYWISSTAKTSIHYIGLSAHFVMQETAVAWLGFGNPVRQGSFIVYATAGVYYSWRSKYSAESPAKMNEIYPQLRK